jgi:acyl-CoA synthetase (AMP-forming)/AMP-acid ligase II
MALMEDDRYLIINPFSHSFGLKAGILTCISAGAAMFPAPIFDAEQTLRVISDCRITAFPGPPTVLQSILDHPNRSRYDISSLTKSNTGAADIPSGLIWRMLDELHLKVMTTGYGLTEAGTVSSTSPSDDPEVVAETVGQPRPGFEIDIVDEDGSSLGTGVVGEVTVRGPSVMLGYLDDPQATAAVLSSDGWLHTGDLGTLDWEGRLRIVGRIKDMIIVGGFNAYPAEIESIVLRHPDVAQVAVIGVPDVRLGEVGMAFVVARSGRDDLDFAEEFLRWCKANMANYKVPRYVEVTDSLPVNSTGKVLKEALRARAAELSRHATGE